MGCIILAPREGHASKLGALALVAVIAFDLHALPPRDHAPNVLQRRETRRRQVHMADNKGGE